MDVIIISNELQIRLGCFLGLFALLAIAEVIIPRRDLKIPRLKRWGNNLGLSAFNSILVKMMFPIAGTGLAVLCMENQWGLLNFLNLPIWLGIGIYIIVFDFSIYWQHRLFHLVDPLWRLHRMHHTDLDYDITTGNRFHPLSIVISIVIKMIVVLIMGPVLVAVLISEVLLNLTSMFNHSNIQLPQKVDKLLRLVLVTPDMHSIHHSQDELEHNCNFGFCFPWWDRMFSTYLDEAALAHQSLKIGIKGFDEDNSIWIHNLLVQPFADK